MPTTVTAPMQAKADRLVELLGTFSRGRSKQTGQEFYVVPASNRLTAHWTAVDGSGCTCLGHQRRGTCTHSIAARTRYDRLGLAPESVVDLAFAATATRLRGDQAGAAITTFGPCISKSGCDQPAGGKSRLCGTHLDALLDQLGA